MVWIKFAFCIAIIFFFGRRVAKYGDLIAHKTGLGGLWVGLVLISLVTSLPELFTGVSAITIVKLPDLTVGNILGANTFNLLNLALLDILHKNGSLFGAVSPSHRLTGWFSLLLILVAALGIFISRWSSAGGIGWIGWYTPVIIALYLLSIRWIFLIEKRRQAEPEDKLLCPEWAGTPLSKVYRHFAISAVFIIGAGIWLAMIGAEIAGVTGWGESFVGSLLIAFTTTLPEMTVSFTAMMMGARDLAVANMIGSNLFNITIITIDDLIYLPGPLLSAISPSHLLTAVNLVVMTVIFNFGLRARPRRFFRLSWLNLTLIALFFLGQYLSFTTA